MSEREIGEKSIHEMSITERMRNNLRPRGTLQVIGLHLNDRFFDAGFINSCIDELDRMTARAAVGDVSSNLEKLAYTLLMDSAYIDIEHEREQQARLKGYGLI